MQKPLFSVSPVMLHPLGRGFCVEVILERCTGWANGAVTVGDWEDRDLFSTNAICCCSNAHLTRTVTMVTDQQNTDRKSCQFHCAVVKPIHRLSIKYVLGTL